MKQTTCAFVFFITLVLQSCQDELSIPVAATRSYQQDSEVLNDFMDINKTTHQYYINSNKKTSALSYVMGSDAGELSLVNNTNLSLFKGSVRDINLMTGALATSHSVDYIVMVVSNEVYISQINSDSPIELIQIQSDLHSYQTQYASVTLSKHPEKVDAFDNILTTSINLNPQVYKNAGWSFNVVCKVGNSAREETTNVLFCGVGRNPNLCFEWKIKPSYELAAEWDLSFISGLSNIHQSNVAKINFLR